MTNPNQTQIVKHLILPLSAALLFAWPASAAQEIIIKRRADPMTRNGLFVGGTAAQMERQRQQLARERAAEIAENYRLTLLTNNQLAIERGRRSAATNDAKILDWTRTRAERGEASGQYELGLRHLSGRGVTNDPAAAREWFAKAAAQGHAKARQELARLTNSVPSVRK